MKNFLRDLGLILLMAGHIIRSKTLCKLGLHKMIIRTETLALGETLKTPGCSIFGCGFIDFKKAKIEKPYKGDGCLMAVDEKTGKLINYGGVELRELQEHGIV
jgi:hypothetical protein